MSKFTIVKRKDISVLPVVERGEEDSVKSVSPSQSLSESSSPPVPVVASVGSGMSVGDAKDFIGALKGGKVTLDQNIRDLNLDDDNLSMKSENHDPTGLSVWELVGKRALEKGYPKTSKLYMEYAHFFRVNMVSFERQSRKEMENIHTAQREREDALSMKELNGSEKLLGRRGR